MIGTSASAFCSREEEEVIDARYSYNLARSHLIHDYSTDYNPV